MHMCGETLARLTKGRVRAPLHYVEERDIGKPRYSMPFFVRGRPAAKLLDENVSIANFMEEVVTTARPWVAMPKGSGIEPGCCNRLFPRKASAPILAGTIKSGRDY